MLLQQLWLLNLLLSSIMLSFFWRGMVTPFDLDVTGLSHRNSLSAKAGRAV